MAYTEFLFDVCQQFGLRYYFAKKERHFVEEVTRVTWEMNCLYKAVSYYSTPAQPI